MSRHEKRLISIEQLKEADEVEYCKLKIGDILLCKSRDRIGRVTLIADEPAFIVVHFPGNHVQNTYINKYDNTRSYKVVKDINKNAFNEILRRGKINKKNCMLKI